MPGSSREICAGPLSYSEQPTRAILLLTRIHSLAVSHTLYYCPDAACEHLLLRIRRCAGLAALGYRIAFFIDDYAILSRAHFLLEKRLPGAIVVWRLRCILGLCLLAIVLSFLMNVWLGRAVLVLLVPGTTWIAPWIDEAKKPPIPFSKFCAENVGFTNVVLQNVAEAIVELAFDDREKEKARQTKKVLQEIATSALRAEELKVEQLRKNLDAF